MIWKWQCPSVVVWQNPFDDMEMAMSVRCRLEKEGLKKNYDMAMKMPVRRLGKAFFNDMAMAMSGRVVWEKLFYDTCIAMPISSVVDWEKKFFL